MIEKLIKKNMIYRGNGIDFFCDEVKLPNNAVVKREYINHPGAAAILPFIDEKNIVLVKQYRYPLNQITYEIPAGKIDKNETPSECVIRELKEETGYKAERVEKLLSFFPSAAFSNEVIYIFTGFGLKEGEQNRDDDEFILKDIISFEEAIKMVKMGKIIDSKTIIALIYFEKF